ncbi:MAG: IS5 family transposase [Nitrososphaerales archaeon]
MKFENKWYKLDSIRKIKVSRKKQYKDKRNWKKYNKKLVREVELILDFPLNRRVKQGRGHPYEYSNSLMLSISALIYFNLPFRQTEGLCKAMKKQLKLKKVPDYSTIKRRFSKVNVPIRADSNEPVVIAVDSTGVKVKNRGEWLREQYGKKKRKGYVKLHIAVDIKKKKVLSVRVTDEKKHDSTQMVPLVDGIDNVEKVIADGAYDARYLFNHLDKLGIKPVIRVRDNAIAKAKGSLARKRTVI